MGDLIVSIQLHATGLPAQSDLIMDHIIRLNIDLKNALSGHRQFAVTEYKVRLKGFELPKEMTE